MKTFLQIVRIGVWMLPIQRWLTVAGLALLLLASFTRLPVNLPASSLPASFLGLSLILIAPITAGGVFWRMVSAPRIQRVVPYGRLRLLLGALAFAALASLLWVGGYALAFLDAPPKFRPDAASYLMLVFGCFAFATSAAVGLFMASRSALAMALTFGLWLMPGVILNHYGIDADKPYWADARGLWVLAAIWLLFGIWYLRVRRIGRVGWHTPGEQAMFAVTSSMAPPHSRNQALEQLLLGVSSVRSVVLTWVFASAMMIVVQLWTAQLKGNSDPRVVTAMVFATLSVLCLLMATTAMAISRRSRAAWLLAGLSRESLYFQCERLMLRVALWVGLAYMATFALLWLTLTPRPTVQLIYLVPSMIAPAMAIAWLGLAHVKGWTLLDIALVAGIALAWWYGTAIPIFSKSTHGPWVVLAIQIAAVLALRVFAQGRWRQVDWQRAAPQGAAET